METKKIELTCIGCPMGCPLIVTMEDGAVASVTGNTCPRGDAYARKEVTAHPHRDQHRPRDRRHPGHGQLQDPQ